MFVLCVSLTVWVTFGSPAMIAYWFSVCVV